MSVGAGWLWVREGLWVVVRAREENRENERERERLREGNVGGGS